MDHFITLPDGVRLHARRSGSAAAPAQRVLCIPGLTRNERDFEGVAQSLRSAGFDVVALSLRGRGRSDWAPANTYHPGQYASDVIAALDHLGWPDAVFVGTSLGGIVTMLVAEQQPRRIRAAIINDVGPRLCEEGLVRIGGYLAAGETLEPVCAFDEAVERARAGNEAAFPGRPAAFWRAFARRLYREETPGGWRLDYDQGIAEALRQVGPAPDLWPGWKALGEKPTLLVRGALSDLLTPEIVDEMREARPGFDYREIANVGHAPMLDEPDAAEAILPFLGGLSG